ncbi:MULTISPECIES: hypothetical protein [unclassified Acidovorax]|uniref:hypothetical protein n=1 Tax=unclassified Acidovorax TaxID=2684926 RepID=UPI000B3F875F|nr:MULTISPECIES: hypothetical protein [unclassified Acidovorax]
MRLNNISLAAVVLGGSALLAACGGGGDDPAPDQVVSANTTVAIDKASGPAAVTAILDKEFAFDAVPAFETTAATKLKLTGTGAEPKFELSSDGGTAKGDMSFGSCIFKVTSTTFLPPHFMATLPTITISSCNFFLPIGGFVAGAAPRPVNLQWMLGNATSRPVSLPVSISSSGGITLNNSSVGNATLVTATGATGGGS